MTRETAINLLDNLIGMVEDNQNNDYDEAFKLAIRSLESWDEDLVEVVHGEWIDKGEDYTMKIIRLGGLAVIAEEGTHIYITSVLTAVRRWMKGELNELHKRL